MSFDEFINCVETRITPFKLNESGRSEIALLYNRYSLEFLEECINIGIRQYIKYDGNGDPTKESVDKFLNKLGGIAYNKSQSPLIQEINHLKGFGKKTFACWDDFQANKIILDYVDALKNASWSDAQIVDDLKTDAIRLIGRSYNWSQWCDSMQSWINDIQQWDKDDVITISEAGTIIPKQLFNDAPQYIQNLCRQINASYENNLYDCTAVIMRRLLEILLVLSYQNCNSESDIIDKSGTRHITLDKIIKNAEQNPRLSLSSNTKKDMCLFKDLGNYAAHKIWYNCTQEDIQPHIIKYRVIIEELLYKAGLK